MYLHSHSLLCYSVYIMYVCWTGGEGGVISGGRTELPYSIAETEEEDSGTLNITGHSSALLSEAITTVVCIIL